MGIGFNVVCLAGFGVSMEDEVDAATLLKERSDIVSI